MTDEEDLMIITKSGVTIRMHIDTIRTMGRAAQGVKLISLKGKSEIAAVARVPRSEDEETAELDEDGNPIINEDEANTDSSEENGTDIDNEDAVE